MPGDPTSDVLAATIAAAADVRTPALVLDLDALDHNVATAVARIGAARWMPHVKTAKQRIVVDALLGAGVRAFKAATLEEVDLVAAAARAADTDVEILLAHPPWGANADGAVRRVAEAEATGVRIALLADGPEHLEHLAERARGLGATTIPVYADLDVGMHRTGRPPEAWYAAADRLRRPPFVLVGLSAYEGHLRWSDRDEAAAIHRRVADVARRLGVEHVVTSGTHAFAHALASADLAEGPFHARVSPGTIVFGDRRSREAMGHLGLRQAAYVATRVISAPRADRRTCDAGSKAIAPDCPAPGLEVVGHPELRPLPRSEEHLPLAVDGPTDVRCGDVLLLVPDHVCTTVNLHREALWVRDGRVVGFGPVEARARHLYDPRDREDAP